MGIWSWGTGKAVSERAAKVEEGKRPHLPGRTAENTGSLAPHGEPPGAGSLSELPWGNLPTWASP